MEWSIGFNACKKQMNLFSNDIVKGMFNIMSNNNSWGGGGNEKENALRSNLERCTYPDQTKWIIEKAAKQLFHVYPFFNPDILMFTENGQPRRYIELKGIIEIDIKGKTCKIDYNMMLPFDYPRSPPFVRIVNRNPDYAVDPFYQSLKSKTDPSSFVLNEKLTSVKGWQQSSSLVNVVIECYDMFKNRFPFSKPVQENNSYSNNAWDALYNSKKGTNNSGFGGGSFNNNTNNNNWGANNNSGWGGNNTNNNSWGANNNAGWGANNQPNTWNNNNNNSWGGTSNNNTWGSNSGWGNNNAAWNSPNTNNWNNQPQSSWGNQPTNSWGGASMGGMGGIISGGANVTTTIASAQKLVGKQKQTLQQINNHHQKLIEKVQVLDATKQSLESEENYLRTENFEMTNFLKQNEASASELSSITNIVQPKDAISQQILDLSSSVKAREEVVLFLEAKFNQEELSLQEFMKNLRRVEEAKFEEKILLQKCLKHVAA